MSNAQSVGQKRPDMHGNVQEWVWDYSIDIDQIEGKGPASDAVIKDPRGPDGRGGGGRVLRGGAFYMVAAQLRSAARFSFGPVYDKMSYTGGGFRCARSR